MHARTAACLPTGPHMYTYEMCGEQGKILTTTNNVAWCHFTFQYGGWHSSGSANRRRAETLAQGTVWAGRSQAPTGTNRAETPEPWVRLEPGTRRTVGVLPPWALQGGSPASSRHGRAGQSSVRAPCAAVSTRESCQRLHPGTAPLPRQGCGPTTHACPTVASHPYACREAAGSQVGVPWRTPRWADPETEWGAQGRLMRSPRLTGRIAEIGPELRSC